VLGSSWRAEAMRAWGVEVVVVEIDEAVRKGISEAQVRQKMVNPSLDPDDGGAGGA
jgi:hypothetical protein